ncbi:transposase domain-containing protein [Salinisphaera sp. G21_0]|nr:transposase domain-containing protein [Salinisphaera sp. G21_0]MBO9496265.1 transposase domain-containing protein [Thalassotalea sp. G20_0]
MFSTPFQDFSLLPSVPNYSNVSSMQEKTREPHWFNVSAKITHVLPCSDLIKDHKASDQAPMTNPETTKEQWLQRIEAWHDSGLSQKAWCRQNGVRPSQFGYWKKKLWTMNQPVMRPSSTLPESGKSWTSFQPGAPFTLGRKNWLFADTPKGASAIFYSLIESAKANGLEPFEYLNHTLKELPYGGLRNWSSFYPGQ